MSTAWPKIFATGKIMLIEIYSLVISTYICMYVSIRGGPQNSALAPRPYFLFQTDATDDNIEKLNPPILIATLQLQHCVLS
jgi:hypothetical protein